MHDPRNFSSYLKSTKKAASASLKKNFSGLSRDDLSNAKKCEDHILKMNIDGFNVYVWVIFYFIFFFYFAHTNNYNTLHLQFITGNCYHLQKKEINKKKGRTKSTKYYSLYINN